MLSRFFAPQNSTAPYDGWDELGQWRWRFGAVGACIVFAALFPLVNHSQMYFEPWLQQFFLACISYSIIGGILFWWTKVRPGHYPIRRGAAILHDTAALSYGIILNPTVTLPLFAVMVWVVTGNGLRFGRRYLIAAAVIVQIALLFIYAMVPFDEQYAHVAITLSLTAIVLPAHAYVMLKHTEAARQDAETATRAKSRFLAQASHDLRQPLHACIMLVGNLREKDLAVDVTTIVDRIERSLANASNLFRSLLDSSMLESGKITPRFAPVALGALIRDLVAENNAMSQASKIRFGFVETGAYVFTDRVLLRSMIQNLLSNALKHSNGRVLIGVRRRNGSLALEVWDNGPGISSRELRHVFDEYYQAGKAGEGGHRGVGLGLANVRGLARILNLDANVRSIEGRGTRVAISGMKPVAPRSPTYSGGDVANANDAVMPLADLRIIFIEDDPDVLSVTAELLRKWGCRVEALAAIPESIDERFDLLITDFDLGNGQTGADAITAFRKTNGAEARVIVLTGIGTRSVKLLSEVPHVTIVEKPVHPAELRSLLGAIRLSSG